ncbi:hypothetical protein ABRZ79_01750 [Vibrio vulnificus]|uniref:hypothetical protein n=2 Tax=Vibrio vulnificus TaxID=672 RepID=UPI001029E256|nr:hypothetical protein [Vibrio vulnificus]EGQ7967393.1 hypothetical protein [Vibrio vulnificus]HDY7508853.1 hypothetical protein [Vibrio vulnificus]HDY7512273.1 hypothetical protein [Vibrio vulnificus]HDY7956690.1 hypothetical protein [Vibrio vulnificus]
MLCKFLFSSLNMRNLIVIASFILICSVHTHATTLPVSIDRVETYRINGFLIRVVKHNMEVKPLLEIDKISTPEFRVIDSIEIRSVFIENKEFKFNSSSGVFIESISSRNSELLFSLEYFYLVGGSDYIDCAISINTSSMSPPTCIYKEGVNSE